MLKLLCSLFPSSPPRISSHALLNVMNDGANLTGVAKDYSEHGVQTEDALNVMQSGLAVMSITSAGGDEQKYSVSPVHKSSDVASPLETRGAYTDLSEMCHVDFVASVQRSESSTSPGEITDTLRVLKRQSSKQPRLPSTRTLKSVSARIVSLPDTAPVYSVKTSADFITRRVVSLPTPLDPNTDELPSPHLGPDDLLESYEHIHLPRSRVRVETHGTDMPHTPSPPSSPDSVVIISDKAQLSDDFLQKKTSKDELSCEYNQDNGRFWLFPLFASVSNCCCP